jgi:hypothetical protein
LFEQSALILLDSIVADLMADLPDPVGTMWRDHTNLQQQRLSGACVLVPQHPNLGST